MAEDVTIWPCDEALRVAVDNATANVVRSWVGSVDGNEFGTSIGYVAEGPAELTYNGDHYTLRSGMYFCAPGPFELAGGAGWFAVNPEYRGLFSVGGPIEEDGRLQYIDGCTDTLLIAPTRLGDPCLNLLVLPPHTRQSSHTHPSIRTGLIASGYGRCVTPTAVYDLSPGAVFLITEGAEHCFHTDEEPLRVIAFHPDSDYGPTDQHHPMINRTHLVARSRDTG